LRKDASATSTVSQVDAAGPSGVVYFNAVPVPDSSEDERDKQEEDEVAAFLPMLQDYLRRTFSPILPMITRPMIS
jgi:hypothetical protein